jgi:rare lipoprotein A
VRVNDRGPYAHHRLIDVSEAAARQLGMLQKGVARVRLSPCP